MAVMALFRFPVADGHGRVLAALDLSVLVYLPLNQNPLDPPSARVQKGRHGVELVSGSRWEAPLTVAPLQVAGMAAPGGAEPDRA
ncbi:hypothetical protein [Streptomyces flavofungini]|uniref:hypothetical protein n=1 Tax=Streptomyces flavofungini TaxID=68200 RepID=UPI0025B22E40|nr:hypothetical protein [Streptomyces flavofungini]WJV45362.1 hypothetical protein QUY26_07300 [Streptomyces flavofungini]